MQLNSQQTFERKLRHLIYLESAKFNGAKELHSIEKSFHNLKRKNPEITAQSRETFQTAIDSLWKAQNANNNHIQKNVAIHALHYIGDHIIGKKHDPIFDDELQQQVDMEIITPNEAYTRRITETK